MNRRILCGWSLALMAALPWSAATVAQEFPSRPIKVMIPYPPGGSTDILARLLAARLTTRMGQPVVVENRSGANGAIAVDALAKSPADGYTLLVLTNGQTIGQVLQPGGNWRIERDFEPVVGVASMPNVIVVNASVPAQNLKEFVEAAKASPGKLTFSHPGVGSAQHMAYELFKYVAKVDILGVPYKGGGPAIADAVGGQVHSSVAGVPNIKPHAMSGRLKALAVTGAKRSPAMPDVPTVAEFGYADFEANFWIALIGPKGTPATAVRRINAEANAVFAEPDILSKFSDQGATILGGSPNDLSSLITKDLSTWAGVIQAAKIKPEQ